MTTDCIYQIAMSYCENENKDDRVWFYYLKPLNRNHAEVSCHAIFQEYLEITMVAMSSLPSHT